MCQNGASRSHRLKACSYGPFGVQKWDVLNVNHHLVVNCNGKQFIDICWECILCVCLFIFRIITVLRFHYIYFSNVCVSMAINYFMTLIPQDECVLLTFVNMTPK